MNKQNSHLLKCLQINLRHSKAAGKNLEKVIVDRNADIVFIQEPYVTIKNNIFLIPYLPKNYKIAHNLDNQHAYGAVIIVKSCLAVSQVGDLMANHLVGLEIKTKHKSPPLRVFSLYCRPSCKNFKAVLDDFQSFPGLKNTIIAADINAKNSLWGSKITDKRGKEVETFLNNTQLKIINEKIKHLSYIPAAYSMIDVTFAGEQVTIFDWRFLSTPSLSDHPFIEFTVEIEKVKNERPKIPRIERIETGKFHESLKKKVEGLNITNKELKSEKKSTRL